MSDPQLDRLEARLRTLTILHQRTRLQIERMADDLAKLKELLATAAPRIP